MRMPKPPLIKYLLFYTPYNSIVRIKTGQNAGEHSGEKMAHQKTLYV